MADENQLYVQLFERWVSYIYGNVPDLGHVNRDNSLILLLSQMGYIGSVFVITMSWRLAVGFHTVIDKECPRVLRMAVYVSLSDSLQSIVDIKSLKKNVGCHSWVFQEVNFQLLPASFDCPHILFGLLMLHLQSVDGIISSYMHAVIVLYFCACLCILPFTRNFSIYQRSWSFHSYTSEYLYLALACHILLLFGYAWKLHCSLPFDWAYFTRGRHDSVLHLVFAAI